MGIWSALGTNLGYWAQWGHLLKIWKYRRVLDMNKEIYDQKDIAIGRQCPLVWRIDFSGSKGGETKKPNLLTSINANLRLLQTLTTFSR